MKKIILMSILIVTTLFAFGSVFADYSIRGSDKQVLNQGTYNYTAQFSAWHNDGRSPTFYPFRHNIDGGLGVWSNGIKPSGKSSFDMTINVPNRRYVINLVSDETSLIGTNIVTSKGNAKVTYWEKGILPIKYNSIFTYVYNKELGLVNINLGEIPLSVNEIKIDAIV